MIKLVVSDVDGTLIKPGETRISEKTLSLLGELKEKGVLFAVASGRDYDAIRPLFGKIKNGGISKLKCPLQKVTDCN